MRLQRKVIVVTGAAGKIGQGFVRAILDNGGIAIIGDINSDAALEFKSELDKNYNSKSSFVVKLDITSKESIEELLESVRLKYGQINALVNNAYPRNKDYGKVVEDVTYESFCDNVSMHLGGYFLMCQQFCNFFKNQGNGNIINIASIYGVIPPKFEIYKNTSMTMPIEYSLIKSSIISLTKYLSKYYKKTNIRINTLSPGGILDNQPKEFLNRYNNECLSKGMLHVEDILGGLIFLLSDESKYLNGQNIIIDDGFSI